MTKVAGYNWRGVDLHPVGRDTWEGERNGEWSGKYVKVRVKKSRKGKYSALIKFQHGFMSQPTEEEADTMIEALEMAWEAQYAKLENTLNALKSALLPR